LVLMLIDMGRGLETAETECIVGIGEVNIPKL